MFDMFLNMPFNLGDLPTAIMISEISSLGEGFAFTRIKNGFPFTW